METIRVSDLIEILKNFDQNAKVQFGTTTEIFTDNGLNITKNDIVQVKLASASTTVYFKVDEYV